MIFLLIFLWSVRDDFLRLHAIAQREQYTFCRTFNHIIAEINVSPLKEAFIHDVRLGGLPILSALFRGTHSHPFLAS